MDVNDYSYIINEHVKPIHPSKIILILNDDIPIVQCSRLIHSQFRCSDFQVVLAIHYDHTYSCVFNGPILANGLRIIPMELVVKHKIAKDAVQRATFWQLVQTGFLPIW